MNAIIIIIIYNILLFILKEYNRHCACDIVSCWNTGCSVKMSESDIIELYTTGWLI